MHMSSLSSIMLVGIFTIFFFWSIYGITVIERYFINKSEEMEKSSYSSISEDVESIDSVLNLIDNSINLYVAHKLREFYTTSRQYDVLKIDEDCKDIAESVYSDLNEGFLMNFIDANKVVTSEFWMKYIIKKTSCILLNTVKSLDELKNNSY